MSDSFENQALAIRKFVKGYNKSVVLNSVTFKSMDIIGHSLDTIGSNLSTIVAAFEEIRATSQTTTNNTSRIDTMMEAILESNTQTGKDIGVRVADVNKAADDTARLSSMVGELSRKATDIETLTASIQDVSDRTNILAINASIEAARAGTVGKGFRIIANEVRSLAARTNDFAVNIDTTINEFRSMVSTITDELQGFTKMLTTFRESFNQIEQNYRENASSINETGSFLSQISSTIKEESEALNGGLDSLEGISSSLNDTRVVFSAIMQTYGALDSLLDKDRAD